MTTKSGRTMWTLLVVSGLVVLDAAVSPPPVAAQVATAVSQSAAVEAGVPAGSGQAAGEGDLSISVTCTAYGYANT